MRSSGTAAGRLSRRAGRLLEGCKHARPRAVARVAKRSSRGRGSNCYRVSSNTKSRSRQPAPLLGCQCGRQRLRRGALRTAPIDTCVAEAARARDEHSGRPRKHLRGPSGTGLVRSTRRVGGRPSRPAGVPRSGERVRHRRPENRVARVMWHSGPVAYAASGSRELPVERAERSFSVATLRDAAERCCGWPVRRSY